LCQVAKALAVEARSHLAGRFARQSLQNAANLNGSPHCAYTVECEVQLNCIRK
jgi:hypothetical protein